MGDISAEPSMEDILSSIKRIIAEEGEPVPLRQRRAARDAAPPPEETVEEDDEADLNAVLELRDAIPSAPDPEEEMPRPVSSEPTPPRAAAAPSAAPAAMPSSATVADPAPILSREAASATRGSLDALSRLMVKPEPESDGTLEGLVREMLRPILAEWLDAKLPAMVETMVAAEIARITGQQR